MALRSCNDILHALRLAVLGSRRVKKALGDVLSTVFKVLAFTIWPLVSLWELLNFAIYVGQADSHIEKNYEVHQVMGEAAAFAKVFRTENFRLPSVEEFSVTFHPTKFAAHCAHFSAQPGRYPEPGLSDLSAPTPSDAFVVSCWRGDSYEYYEAHSQNSTALLATNVKEWRRGFYVATLTAIPFACLPFVPLALRRLRVRSIASRVEDA